MIVDIVEYIIMERTMPNETRICRRVLIVKKRRVLLASLPQSSIGFPKRSIGQKRIAGLGWTQKTQLSRLRDRQVLLAVVKE